MCKRIRWLAEELPFPRWSLIVWIAGTILLLLYLVLTLPSTAGAHTVAAGFEPAGQNGVMDANQGVVYNNSQPCVEARAATSHPPSGGQSTAAVAITKDYQQYYNGPIAECSAPVQRPPGWIALYRQWYVWTSRSGTWRWEVCNASGWVFNQNTTSVVSHTRNFDTAICGSDFYGTMASAWSWDAISWKGGSMWSSYHWMPS